MASAPKVGGTSAPSGVSPVSGWGAGGGYRHASSDQIDGASATGSFGLQGGWRPQYDDRHGQGYFFFGQYPQKQDPEQPLFTPLMSRLASAFAAIVPVSDNRATPPILFADMLRGVGIYDFNLRAIAGTLAPQGAVLNRYG